MNKPLIPLSRRQLLLAGAAASALAGCATPVGRARAQVVVVGAGWGGLGAARELARNPAVAVTLVEPNERFMSCPLSAHYIAGLQPATDFQRDYAQVDAAGIRRVRDRVTAIERSSREVVTATSGRLRYDYLVLSPGIDYDEAALPGFAQARAQLPVGFRAFEQGAVRQQVDHFLAEGGTFLITVPKPPYRCPPAPYERACLIAEQMKRRGTRGKVVLLDANPHPMPPPISAPIVNAMKQLYAGQIEYLPSSEVSAIDIGRKAVSSSMGEVRFTHVNAIRPMKAAALVPQSGLGQRWGDVLLPSFQSRADERIYIVGDAGGTPLPKSGHVAFGAGQMVARDIAAKVAGTPTAATGEVSLPPGICWAAVTHDEAIMIHVTGSVSAGQAPQLKMQVDPRHNANSGRASMDWGRGMWTSMLG